MFEILGSEALKYFHLNPIKILRIPFFYKSYKVKKDCKLKTLFLDLIKENVEEKQNSIQVIKRKRN